MKLTSLSETDIMEPEYDYWLDKGSWKIKDACFLLMGINPDMFNDNSALVTHLSVGSSGKMPAGIKERLNQDLTVRNFEYSFDKWYEQIYAKLNQTAFKHSFLCAVDHGKILYWAMMLNINIPKALYDLVCARGFVFGELVGEFENCGEWLDHDLWTLEEAILLARGFNPHSVSASYWYPFEVYKNLALKSITAKILKAERMLPGGMNWLVAPIDFLLWASDKKVLVSKSLLEEVSNLKKSKEKNNGKEHGNSINNAAKREEILAAALGLICIHPNDCRSKSSGAINATKVTKLIELNTKMYWPNKTEPPLTPRKITEVISEALTKTKNNITRPTNKNK